MFLYIDSRAALNDRDLDQGGGSGGALRYFLGGYVPPGTPNWHPVLKKIFFLKLIPHSRNGPTFYTPF